VTNPTGGRTVVLRPVALLQYNIAPREQQVEAGGGDEEEEEEAPSSGVCLLGDTSVVVVIRCVGSHEA
jgi:hypothetical protein